MQAFVNRFGEYSASVLKHLRATLSCVFDTAVKWQYIKTNPVAGLDLPAGKQVKRAQILTPEQIQAVIRALPEPYRTMIVVLAGTVIRECELLALKWEDIDFLSRVIHVRRSLYRGNVDEDKNTDTSTRDLPAGPTVFQFLAGLHSTEHNRGDYVFMTPDGTLCEPSNIRARVFHPCAEANGLPAFSFSQFQADGRNVHSQFGRALEGSARNHGSCRRRDVADLQ